MGRLFSFRPTKDLRTFDEKFTLCLDNLLYSCGSVANAKRIIYIFELVYQCKSISLLKLVHCFERRKKRTMKEKITLWCIFLFEFKSIESCNWTGSALILFCAFDYFRCCFSCCRWFFVCACFSSFNFILFFSAVPRFKLHKIVSVDSRRNFSTIYNRKWWPYKMWAHHMNKQTCKWNEQMRLFERTKNFGPDK